MKTDKPLVYVSEVEPLDAEFWDRRLVCMHQEHVPSEIFLALMLPLLFGALATGIVSFNAKSVLA